jgi:hypothetical protein
MDPRSQIRTVYVRYWTGKGAKPQGVKDPKIGWQPIPRSEQLNLKLPDTQSSLAVATGELTLPADVSDLVMQVASENINGQVSASEPAEYRLNVKDEPNGSDARPMQELINSASTMAGQTIVVRGKIPNMPTYHEAYGNMIVADTNKKIPERIRFVTTKRVLACLDEIESNIYLNDVRFVYVVGKTGPDLVTTVRVVRCDYLNESDRIVYSLPDQETKEPLVLLNRNPEKYLGQKLTFKAFAYPGTVLDGAGHHMPLFFENHTGPRNIQCQLEPKVYQKLKELKVRFGAYLKVRIVAKVNYDDMSERHILSVSRLEFLDPKDDSVMKVLE